VTIPARDIRELKQRISAISDGAEAPMDAPLISTGCLEIDLGLPSAGLATGTVHEIAGAGYRDRSAALGFTLGLTARLLKERPGPLIWCQLRDRDRLHIHAPGLMAFGIDPGRITKVTLNQEADLLWAMEEALDCPYLAGVIGILWSEKLYNFTSSRRLSLRAKKSGVTALMVRSHRANGTSTAKTRWRIANAPSESPNHDKTALPRLGKAQWRVDLTRCGNGFEKKWDVVWNHEAIRFDLASRVANRAPVSAQEPATATG